MSAGIALLVSGAVGGVDVVIVCSLACGAIGPTAGSVLSGPTLPEITPSTARAPTAPTPIVAKPDFHCFDCTTASPIPINVSPQGGSTPSQRRGRESSRRDSGTPCDQGETPAHTPGPDRGRSSLVLIGCTLKNFDVASRIHDDCDVSTLPEADEADAMAEQSLILRNVFRVFASFSALNTTTSPPPPRAARAV